MAATIEIELDQARINDLLRSPSGIVGQDMWRRGGNVESRAQALVPQDTGALARDIHRERLLGSAGVRVGSDLPYARWVHDGTGIYRPGGGAMIRPIRGQYLVFTPKGATSPVFARQVRGMRGTPYLADALPAALT